jgi:hypothetical protein
MNKTGLIKVITIGVIFITGAITSQWAYPAGDRLHISSETRFIVNDNGTVSDTATGLMWAAHDNGVSTTWKEAKEYCENYHGGGYTDWRMPTVDELAGIYDKNEAGYRPECAVYDWKVFITEKIHLSGCSPWASGDHGAEAECFMFDYGKKSLMFKSVNFIMRALPVRDPQFINNIL